MGYSYALQIAVIALALSALGLGGVTIASRIYDRNTRRYDEAERSQNIEQFDVSE